MPKIKKADALEGISELLPELAELKRKAASINDEIAAVQSELVSLFRSYGDTSVDLDFDDGTKIRGSLVEPETLKIDETGLLEALTPSQVKKITKHVVDRKRLESAIADGTVPIELVDDFSTISKSSPYIRLTTQ